MIGSLCSPPEARGLASLSPGALPIIWQRLGPIIGPAALRAMAQSALDAAADDHPLLRRITFAEDGPVIPGSPDADGEWASATRAFVHRLLQILESLTGDVLVSPLLAELKQSHAGPTGPGSHDAEPMDVSTNVSK